MTSPVIGELFSGFGGLGQAAQGVFGGRIAWHSEIDPGACEVLAARYPDAPNHGDITAIDWDTVEPVDILCGGFPCQDLSIGGPRDGMAIGNRSGLWHEFAEAIRCLRPSLVVIENVRGLLTSRGAPPTPELLAAWSERDRLDRAVTLVTSKLGKAQREQKPFYVQQHATDRVRLVVARDRAVAAAKRADARIVRAIGTVLGTLAGLGFDAQWHSLKACDVGAPHERFRVFLVAWPRVAQDTDVAARRERWLAAPGQAEGGRARADARGRGRAPAAHTDGDAVRQQSVAVAGRGGAAVAELTGAGPAADAERLRLPGGGAAGAGETNQPGKGPRTPAEGRGADADAVEWGRYAFAVRRWEHATGARAPAPAVRGRSGKPRLNPEFVEWMMGAAPGWVTAVPGLTEPDMLRMLGNGVVRQQGAEALRQMLPALPAHALAWLDAATAETA